MCVVRWGFDIMMLKGRGYAGQGVCPIDHSCATNRAGEALLHVMVLKLAFWKGILSIVMTFRACLSRIQVQINEVSEFRPATKSR